MGLKVALFLALSMVVCSFCGKDFQSVNRHAWRCQARMEDVNPDTNEETAEPVNPTGEIQCICGKICKGVRGLRGHQRSCRSIKHMSDKLSINDIQDATGNVARISTLLEETPVTKPGIKLPKTSEEWDLANTFLQSKLNNIDVRTTGVSYAIDQLNKVTYEYFRETYGLINKGDEVAEELRNAYKDLSKKDLKKELKKLKNQQPQDSIEIRYVARLLREKLKGNVSSERPLKKDDTVLQRNFWGFCKRLFVKSNETKPTFSKSICENYFLKILSPLNPSKAFNLPSWIPSLQAPTVQFTNQPVTYRKICKIVNRMKSSGSPCPLD